MNKHLNEIYESRIFDMSFRGTSNDLSSVKIFTSKNSFEMERQISFDSEYEQISSLEYFAGSVLSSILLTLIEQSKKSGSVVIEEIEGILNLSLENPLSMLGVKGYDEEPVIKKITVTIFLLVDLDDNDCNDFCFKSLKNAPIYNTLKRAMELEIILKKIL